MKRLTYNTSREINGEPINCDNPLHMEEMMKRAFRCGVNIVMQGSDTKAYLRKANGKYLMNALGAVHWRNGNKTGIRAAFMQGVFVGRMNKKGE